MNVTVTLTIHGDPGTISLNIHKVAWTSMNVTVTLTIQELSVIHTKLSHCQIFLEAALKVTWCQ